jgi:hypothetical protein
MQKGIFSSYTLDDEPQVNEWLKRKGIEHTIGDLYHDRDLCPECGRELLEVFKSPLSFHLRAAIARALFERKLDASLKREAVGTLLALIKQNPEQESSLSILILNELAGNATADRVHEIGRMMLDEGFGELRSAFAFALRKLRSEEAIAYLKQAAKIPRTAAAALFSLAQLRAEGTLELCEEALKTPGMLYKDAIKETQRKLRRKLAKTKATASHITTEPIPDGMDEWSANLDGTDLKKVLRGIQKCVEEGFGKAEIAEARAAAEDLSPDETSADEERDIARLKFDVKFNGSDHQLWLEVFCDDEDAYDLYVFGHPKLIKELEAALGKILPD